MTLPDWPVVATDETGQRHGPFNSKVRDELMRMEIMWQDAAGEFHIKSEHKDIVARNPHIAVCDLCSESPVVWDADVGAYASHTEAGPYSDWISEGGYFLCEPCGQFVLARDREGLFRRTIRTFMNRWVTQIPSLAERIVMRVILEGEMKPLHEQFWANFKGIKRIEP
jgi:hypothetical protein